MLSEKGDKYTYVYIIYNPGIWKISQEYPCVGNLHGREKTEGKYYVMPPFLRSQMN